MDKVAQFIKYPGGKTQLMSHIVEKARAVPVITTYIQPFIGSASVLMGLINAGILTMNTKIYISDLNSSLINMFEVIKEDPQRFILAVEAELVKLNANKRTVYNQNRELYNLYILSNVNTQDIKFKKSVLFMVLNISCFNGLYRVNSKGEFNTPIGVTANGADFMLTDAKKRNIRLFNEILNKYDIIMCVQDYIQSSKVITDPQTTLLYADPPYVPINATSFTKYMGDFSHKTFFEFASGLDCYVLISNSDTTICSIGLIKFNRTRVDVRRMISSKTRDMCTEILADNFSNFDIIIGNTELDYIELFELIDQI